MPSKKSKQDPYVLSPALALLRQVVEATRASDRRCVYAFDHAMRAAIQGHARFAPDDLVRARAHYQSYARTDEERAGLSLYRWLGEGSIERWYALAAEARSATALTAVERLLNRPRVVVEGEILHKGARTRLPEAVYGDNRGGHCEVSSYSKDGLYVNFLYREDGHYDYDKVVCHVCLHGYAVGRATKRRLKIPVATLVEREKARLAVMRRCFEVVNPTADPRVREYAGNALVDAYRGQVVALAKLEVGEGVCLGVDGTRDSIIVRRVAYRTHDALARAARGELFGEHRGSRGRDRDTISDLHQMAKDGLVVPQPSEAYGSYVKFVLTEKGRERLDALSTRQERETAQAQRSIEREIEAKARRRLAELTDSARTLTAEEASRQTGISLTEADLDREVSFRDSRAVGNCQTGTLAWIAQHLPDADPHKDTITVRQLVALDGGKNRINVCAVLRFVLRRHPSQG